MATYKELHGTDIEVRSTDPSDPVTGQLWYNTTTDQLISIVRETDNTISRLLVVGHNPTFSDTLNLLCRRTPKEDMEYSMSSACLAVISFKCSWHEVGKDYAQLHFLISPRNLP